MKSWLHIIFLLFANTSMSQPFDTTRFSIKVEVTEEANSFFTRDIFWRGADGASSIDLGNGKILWLFSDSFISRDSSGTRNNAIFARNSIAIQDGYDLELAATKFYWNRSQPEPKAFFCAPTGSWFWTGHGTMIKDKLIIFLIKEKPIETGLGFKATGWYVVLISNPYDDPAVWNMDYFEGPETFGTIAGSAAVLKDEEYLYAYGSVEPDKHDVYVLRWKLDDAYTGNIKNPEWWLNGKWAPRKSMLPVPKPLFTGQTEYSVHYDAILKKFIQVQSFGFGKASLGIRMADHITGPWTELHIFHTPGYPYVKDPFMYTAKAHPEIKADGLYVTYNVNSFDFSELIKNKNIYFPKFIRVKISEKIKN